MTTTVVVTDAAPIVTVTTGGTASTIANIGAGTLAQLNTAVTDATLDDSGDARIPIAHATTHEKGADAVTVENLATSGANGSVPTSDGAGNLTMSVPSGSGDVVGGASSTADEVVVYNSTSGKIIKAASTDVGFGGQAITNVGNVDGRDVAADGALAASAVQPGDSTTGDLGGTYSASTVAAVTTTTGPTSMTVGAVADGEYLKRSGSTLIGDTPAGGGGGDEFGDDVFRIQDDGDATKEIAFQASGITTGTTRTITAPDTNVDLGDIATNTTHGANTSNPHSVTAAQAGAATAAQGSTADSAIQPGDSTTGDIGGTYSASTVAAITTTTGPTSLVIGAVGEGEFLTRSGSTLVGSTPSGSGDVVGPASATDNALVTFDGTTGKLIQVPNAAISVGGQTLDGRAISTDGTKLDGIEASADVTDATNVAAAGAVMDSEVTNLAQVKAFDTTDYATSAQGTTADSAQQPPSEGAFANGDKTKLDGIEAAADVTDTANVTSSGALMDSEVANLAAVKAFDGSDYATSAQGTLAASAQQPPAEGAFTDGDKTKLDAIESGADVTDTTNVTASGAVMDSEVTNLADVKAFDTTDYATAAQGVLADSAIHDDVAGEIAALTLVTAIAGDFVLIEDATDSNNKKRANVSDFIGAGTDAAAIHDDTAGEINALTTKATPTTSDMVLIEDAADSFNKKKAAWPSTGGGGSAQIFNFSADELGTPDPVGPLIGYETNTVDAALTFDVDISTDHIDGDLLVAIVANAGISGTSPTFSTPSGWTSEDSFLTVTGGSQPLCHIFSKIASSEGADETFTISGAVNSALAGIIMVFRHCTYGAEGTANTATDAAPVSPTITPTGPGYAFFLSLNDYNLYAPIRPFEFPDGADTIGTETKGVVVLSASGAGNNGLGLGVAYSENSGIASGTRVWTLDGTDGNGSQSFSVLKTEDWAVSGIAIADDDTNSPGLRMRRFDDTTEQGVCLTLEAPTGSTDMTLRFKSRADIAAAANVISKIYIREFPDAGAVESWSAGTAMTAVAMAADAYWQYDTQTITLSTLSMVAGRLFQLELTRDAGNVSDTLTGDWLLSHLEIEFS